MEFYRFSYFLNYIRLYLNLYGTVIPSFCFFLFLLSIKFEFGLAAYANGGNSNFIFNAAVDLTIFGKRLYLALGFNLKDPVGSLRTGADKSTEWYKDKMNPKNPTDTEKNYYDSPNPFADFEMSGTILN